VNIIGENQNAKSVKEVLFVNIIKEEIIVNSVEVQDYAYHLGVK